MKTVYYTFYTCDQEKASGGEEGRPALMRTPAPRRTAPAGRGGSKIVSLDEYRARHTAPARESRPEEDAAAWEEAGPRRRGAPRGERAVLPVLSRVLLAGLELAACAAIIAVAAAACALFLT